MENKTHIYNSIFLLLLISLISFSYEIKEKGSDRIIAIDYAHDKSVTEIEMEESFQIQRFRVDFTEGKVIPYYIKIELTVSGNFNTPILCFSPTDSNCKDNIEQIVKNPNGNSVLMWIKREQFEKEDQELYINVHSQSAGNNYILKISGDQAAQYGPNFVYSYLIGSSNKEMMFEVKGNGQSGTLIIAIDGSKTSNIDIKHCNTLNDFDRGKYCNIDVIEPLNDTDTITIITVKGGTNGDYITLSVHLVDDDGISTILEPNGPEIIGALENIGLKEECFKMSSFASSTYQNINKFYLTGRLHSNYAYIYLRDESGNIIKETEEMVIGGHLSKIIDSNNKIKYLCFTFPPQEYNIKANDVIYTISLSEPITLDSLYNYYPPQMTGEIYRRILPKGKIAFFSSYQLESSAKKYSYNMYTIKGMPKMYISKCNTYPNCQYTTEDLKNLENPKSTNQMTIWITESDLSSTLGSEKNVIVVHCLDDGNDESGYCIFETSVFNKGQTTNLVENEKFSNFVLKDEKGIFKLNLGVGVKTQRVTVDIMIFSGDVNFKVIENFKSLNKLGDKEEIQLNYNKYLLSNKVFFHFNLAQLSLIELYIEFTASLNSFFTIQYGTNGYNINQLEEKIPSGEHYLVQIDPTQYLRTKNVLLQNFRYKIGKPFLANFFALNCDFQVKRGDKIIGFFDGYAQEVLSKDSKEYNSENYNYEIKITEPDLSNYNHKMCMLYVSGIESKDDLYEKEIIVGENINQQIIFENGFDKVRFLYPQADSEKDLAIYVNIIDQAYYTIKIFFNTKEYQSKILTRTQIFYIPLTDIMDVCKKDQLCSIVVQIELTNKFIKTDPMIEITIRQIKNIPSYIQKGMAKRDFVCGDNYYYLYTDIGKNEEGEVLVDFLRDFGNIWGKIVRKDQTSIDEEANWRGIYRMPSQDWEDSLEYNGYIKKLKLRPENTADCIEGCYLLLSIRVSQIGEYVDDSKFYPFSIITRINPNNRAYTDIPKVVIQVDEYIIGNVDVSDSDRISDFYEVWLPHDADRVDFDWQSGVAGLYVNLGGIRPTTKNADFRLSPPGKDSILSLTRKQILDRCKEKKITPPYENSIQDLSLVIGVWTDKTSAIETEIYSLRVHEVDESEENKKFDIIEVNADKKVICKPHLIRDGEYRCLFMITYDNDKYILATPLYIHASSLDVSAMTYMYASYIERKAFDEFDKAELEKFTPTHETATYNSKTDGVDYIYIPTLDQQKYIYLSIITDSPEDVMLLSGMPLFDYISFDIIKFYPTPGKEQLLACRGEKLTLYFATEKSILVNIVTLFGEAEISWENDPNTIYSLRGRGDRLTLSSGKSVDQLIIRKKMQEDSKLSEKIGNPGFLFYISYYLKETKYNFDEVIYGKSLEFSYKETDLPVILYSKIGNFSSDINVAVTFKDIDTISNGIYQKSPIFVRASLIKENTVYKAKNDPELAPSADRLVIGSYDTALRTAQVMLSKELMSNYNLKESDNPTLYLSIEKNTEVTNKTFDKFSVEVQFSKANEGVIPTEKVYHYGRVGEQNRMTYYKLRINKIKTYMRIQAAFNSENVDFYVTNDLRTNSNMTFLNTQKERGKIYVDIDTKGFKTQECLYIIFYKKKTNANKYLYNYVFKYINSEKLEEYIDYKIVSSEELSIKENINNNKPEESTIECSFHKLDIDKSKANITYFFKVVIAENYIPGESSDTIAVTESSYLSVFTRNPEDKNGLITLTAKGDLSRWTIIQVIAQIQQETILEYVSYKGHYIYRPPKESNDNGNNAGKVNATAFYVVGAILIILVIGLIVAIIYFKIRNQALLEQVKHVSFQKTNSANYKKNTNKNSNVDPSNLIQNENK